MSKKIPNKKEVMKNKKLELTKQDGTKSAEEKPIIVNWTTADSLKKLEALVEKHGVIYIPTVNGLPLKITRAQLF